MTDMYTMNKNLPITAAEPIHYTIVASMHGNGQHSMSLGKQWLAKQLGISVEAAQDYTLLAYVGKHRWYIIAA
jgi:hypothetical protein